MSLPHEECYECLSTMEEEAKKHVEEFFRERDVFSSLPDDKALAVAFDIILGGFTWEQAKIINKLDNLKGGLKNGSDSK